jgi:hypothetical protein
VDDEVYSCGGGTLHSVEEIGYAANAFDAGADTVVDGAIGGKEGRGEVSRHVENEREGMTSCRKWNIAEGDDLDGSVKVIVDVNFALEDKVELKRETIPQGRHAS